MNKDQARPKQDKVQLTLEEGGYKSPSDPRFAGPPLPGDRRRTEKLCMNAQSLVVETDGTTGHTTIIVDGVPLGGLIKFELIVQRGYPRVTAVVEQTYVREDLKEYGEMANKEVLTESGQGPATVVIDVFKRS